jgi:hypothetical protein
MPEQLQVSVNGETYLWRMDQDAASIDEKWNVLMPDTPTPRHRAYRDLHRLLRPLRFEQQEEALIALREQLGDNGLGRPGYLALSPKEVQRLAAGGLVEIGSHTVSHPVLSVQPLEDQRHELVESKRQLETILGHPVTTLAYSYGDRSDAGNATAALAREVGYQVGCSNFPALVTHHSDNFQLPRFLVRDWDGDEFAGRLAGWFHG